MASKKDLTLYFHHGSYYSQRAVLTLEEKGIVYKPRIINHYYGDNVQPWYLDINFKGEVPSITHGDQNVIDSNTILDYLEEEFPEAPRLQPDESTPEGRKVRDWRNRINDIPIEIITYGCLVFRDEFTQNSTIPAFVTKVMPGKLMKQISTLPKLMDKYPKYKEAYEQKKAKFETFHQNFSSIDKVRSGIDTLDVILEEIEEQLQQTKEGVPEGEEHWFLGQTFTAADLYLAVLLNRMRFVGLLHHFQDSKPLLSEYYARLQQRESFLKSCVNIPIFDLKFLSGLLLKKLTPIMIGAAGVITAVVAAYWYIKKK